LLVDFRFVAHTFARNRFLESDHTIVEMHSEFPENSRAHPRIVSGRSISAPEWKAVNIHPSN
jgi:hypothetical protein